MIDHVFDERVDAAGDHVADRHADEDGRNLHEHVFNEPDGRLLQRHQAR